MGDLNIGEMGRTITSGFSPKREPRPTYPSALSMIRSSLVSHLRSTLITVILTQLVASSFFTTVDFLERAGFSDRVIFTVISCTVHTACYVVVNLVFFEWFCGSLGFFSEYRMGRKPVQEPSAALRRKTLTDAAFGQLVILPALVYFFFPHLQQLGMP